VEKIEMRDTKNGGLIRDAPGKQGDYSGFVLLILEDFDEIRAYLSRHFIQHHYDVFSSATLRDALAIAWEETPTAILIDYMICGETAFRAIERLHEAAPKSYIVLVGGTGTEEIKQHALTVGASQVLPKAYTISDMDNIVRDATTKFGDQAIAVS
jgi:DNA-binding response OmpR family regulator